jgi:hypothetical protein
MYIAKLLVLALGFAVLVTDVGRAAWPEVPGWRLFASALPLSLIASAVLALMPSEA